MGEINIQRAAQALGLDTQINRDREDLDREIRKAKEVLFELLEKKRKNIGWHTSEAVTAGVHISRRFPWLSVAGDGGYLTLWSERQPHRFIVREGDGIRPVYLSNPVFNYRVGVDRAYHVFVQTDVEKEVRADTMFESASRYNVRRTQAWHPHHNGGTVCFGNNRFDDVAESINEARNIPLLIDQIATWMRDITVGDNYGNKPYPFELETAETTVPREFNWDANIGAHLRLKNLALTHLDELEQRFLLDVNERDREVVLEIANNLKEWSADFDDDTCVLPDFVKELLMWKEREIDAVNLFIDELALFRFMLGVRAAGSDLRNYVLFNVALGDIVTRRCSILHVPSAEPSDWVWDVSRFAAEQYKLLCEIVDEIR